MKKLFMFFIAAALIAAFSVPAAADDAEWSFYGSARMTTFMTDTSDGTDSDEDLTWAQQGNSRIGAKVSAGDVGGHFEYGTSGGSANIRLLYGTWNFGGGTLLLGQTYSPVNIFISNQVFGSDNDMLNTGGVYGGRQQMIQASFGGFKVALVSPSTIGVPAGDVDTTLPKIELAYTFKSDMFTAGVVAGYNSVEDDTVGGEDYVSNVIGLWGAVNFGPAYVKMNVYQAVNEQNYGLAAGFHVGNGLQQADEDTTTIGALLVVGAKLSDTFALEGGYGQTTHDNDLFASDDTTNAMYVQATIGLAPGVFIVPEIGVIDYDEGTTNNDQGDVTYFGAKWQINF